MHDEAVPVYEIPDERSQGPSPARDESRRAGAAQRKLSDAGRRHPQNGPALGLSLCVGVAYAWGLLLGANAFTTPPKPKPGLGTVRVVSVPRERPEPQLTSLPTRQPMLRLPIEMDAPARIEFEPEPLPPTAWEAITNSLEYEAAGPPPVFAGEVRSKAKQLSPESSEFAADSRPLPPEKLADFRNREYSENAGGSVLVMAVLINHEGRVLIAKIMVPSRDPEGDQKYVTALTGSNLGKPSPPLSSGETRWTDVRINYDVPSDRLPEE